MCMYQVLSVRQSCHVLGTIGIRYQVMQYVIGLMH